MLDKFAQGPRSKVIELLLKIELFQPKLWLGISVVIKCGGMDHGATNTIAPWMDIINE